MSGPYGSPGGGAVSYKGGTPVWGKIEDVLDLFKGLLSSQHRRRLELVLYHGSAVGSHQYLGSKVCLSPDFACLRFGALVL